MNIHEPKVVLAKKSGFCFGVKRAVDLALKTSGPIFTLGPLIHNPQVIARLEDKGVRSVESLDQVEGGRLIIRAHGIPRSIVSEAETRGLTVIDATCPFVRKVQQTAQSMSREGYQVVIIGEANHPEVIGIADRVDRPIILETLAQAAALGRYLRIGVVAQTTQSEESYRAIVRELKKHTKAMKVADTICNATKKNQEAAKALAERVEVMIVVGGYNSGNTRRLAGLCSAIVTTHHIEVAGELQAVWFEGKTSVGVTGGASTPDWIIKDIVERIEHGF
jgi:(E)-4-hydroxy-3-methyl-but-2-enyl pyrophosphate reductase